MKKLNIIIEAIITTRSPLSIAMPVAGPGKDKEYKNFPVMLRGMTEDDSSEKATLSGKTAFLPASTVRGFLRRSAGIAAMEKRGVGQTTLKQAYSDILGQCKDNKEEVSLVELTKIREADAILDLFGSWGIKSRVLVSNFLPKQNIEPQSIVGVRKDLGDTDGVVENMSADEQFAYHNRAELNNRRSSSAKIVKDLERQIRKHKKDSAEAADLAAPLEAAQKKLEELKSDLGDMANSSRNIHEYFTIPAETDLYGKIVIEQFKERDLDIILRSLEDLSVRPILGANVARGCGEISGVFTINVFAIKVDGKHVKKHVKTVKTGGWESSKVEDFAPLVTAAAE